MRAMWALDHALHRVSKRMASTLGVTAPQRLVVRVLGEQSPTTAGTLARMLHLHPSTLTGVIQRLERDGLIQRSIERSDKRRSRLVLTDRGRLVNSRHAGTVEAGIQQSLKRLSRADTETAIRVLVTVASTLREMQEAPIRRGRTRSRRS